MLVETAFLLTFLCSSISAYTPLGSSSSEQSSYASTSSSEPTASPRMSEFEIYSRILQEMVDKDEKVEKLQIIAYKKEFEMRRLRSVLNGTQPGQFQHIENAITYLNDELSEIQYRINERKNWIVQQWSEHLVEEYGPVGNDTELAKQLRDAPYSIRSSEESEEDKRPSRRWNDDDEESPRIASRFRSGGGGGQNRPYRRPYTRSGYVPRGNFSGRSVGYRPPFMGGLRGRRTTQPTSSV